MIQREFPVTTTGSYSLLEISGDVDFSMRNAFERALDGMKTSPTAIVSFEHCSFCDSSIIGALMKLHKSSGDANVVLVVPSTNPVSRIFELVGVSRVLTVVQSLTEAERLAGGPATAP